MSAGDISVGNELRQERLRKRLDLAVIAKETRIGTAILEAIENDRFECVPGGAYRRLLLRQYARALGMDSDAIIAEFKRQYVEPPLPLPVPPKRSRSPIWADLAWAIGVLACLAATYAVTQARRATASHHEQAAAQTERIGQAARQAAPAAVAPSIPDRLAPPARTAPSGPPTAPSTAPVQVSFTATESVWLSVKCDGNATYAGLLEVRQSRTFDATNAVTALIGNAGGVQISLNDKPVGPLGAHGETATVEFTVHGMQRIAHGANAPGAGQTPSSESAHKRV